jgi:hypothetical protein
MPHRGVSCHLYDDVVPSFFTNLPQKGHAHSLGLLPVVRRRIVLLILASSRIHGSAFPGTQECLRLF